MARAASQRPALALLALLLAPTALGQEAHENFDRAATDVESLRALGATILNTTEAALAATLGADDANASRRARLLTALTADLPLIASASDVESGAYLAPLVHPYTSIAQNATNLTRGFAQARGVGDPRLVPLVRVQTQGMLGDADNFDALGFDTARLRELIDLLLLDLDRLESLRPAPPRPFMLLLADPGTVALGGSVVLRGIVTPAPLNATEVRLALDGAPWRTVRLDERGAFGVAYEVPADARLGAHRADAEARSDGVTLRANATFQVVRVGTLLTLAPERPSYAPNVSVVLRARLLDAAREPLSGAQARLQVDDQPPVNVTFRSDGSAFLRFEPDAFGRGPHEATMTYAGDDVHDPAIATATWTVAVPGSGGTGSGTGTGTGGGSGGPPVEEPEPTPGDGPGVPPPTASWLPWVLVLAGVLAVEELARRLVAARWPAALAERRHRHAIERLAPLPRDLPATDPRRIVILAYRDVLLALAHEGVPIEHMTHREVAATLEAAGRDPESVRIVTDLFERVRYAAAPLPAGALGAYLPSVLRLTRRGAA